MKEKSQIKISLKPQMELNTIFIKEIQSLEEMINRNLDSWYTLNMQHSSAHIDPNHLLMF